MAELALLENSLEDCQGWLALAAGADGEIVDVRYGTVAVADYGSYLRGRLLLAQGEKGAAARELGEISSRARPYLFGTFHLAVNRLLVLAGGSGREYFTGTGAITPKEEIQEGVTLVAFARSRDDAASAARRVEELRRSYAEDDGLRMTFARNAYAAGLDDLVVDALTDLPASRSGSWFLYCRTAVRAVSSG